METAQAQPRRARKVPLAVVVATILLALAGGVALLRHWLREDPKKSEAVVLDLDPSQLRGNRGMGPARPASAVTVRKDGSLFTSIGTLHLTIPAKPGEPLDLHNHAADQWMTAEQRELLNLAERILRLAARNNKMTLVSAEQIEQLKKVPTGTQIQLTVSSADQTRLANLVSAWQKSALAGRAAAEKALLAALKEIGDKAEAAARQAMANNARNVKDILTPEQIARFKAMRNAPATRPADPTSGAADHNRAHPVNRGLHPVNIIQPLPELS